ncbi:MAG: GMC family oxidoreductase [Flavobacteriales bacterium]|jgi:choline dehydrogenase-like flavoprotein|nr:GMC family oxidoreductase [Flavobacteriales bacterium]
MSSCSKMVYDAVIIGSGAGGSPIALELCKKGLNVVMLEKGQLLKPDTPQKILEKYYVGQGFTISLNGGSTIVLAGSAVGGTTAINSGTCFRPLQECLAQWDKITGLGFSDGLLDPYFPKVENQLGVCVPNASLLSKSATKIDEGLQKLRGEKSFILPRNSPNCSGKGLCCFCCPTKAKRSTDISYLPEAVEKGLHLMIGTKAIGIREESDLIRVVIETDGEKNEVRGKKLIISAGALYTPGLLKRNKLGDKYRLAGTHLKIHPANKVFAHFPGLKHGVGGIPQGTGYKPPELPRITMEGIHTPESMTAPIVSAAGKRFNWWMKNHDDMASFGLMVRDRGTGRVIDKGSFPVMSYLLHPEDTKDFVNGLKLIGEIFFAAGAKRVLLPFLGPNQNEFEAAAQLKSVDASAISAKDIILSGFHPQGTAGIGRVVDQNLKLSGTKNIYVCDGSVLPDSPGVNPMISIMAFSQRLGEYLYDKSGTS